MYLHQWFNRGLRDCWPGCTQFKVETGDKIALCEPPDLKLRACKTFSSTNVHGTLILLYTKDCTIWQSLLRAKDRWLPQELCRDSLLPHFISKETEVHIMSEIQPKSERQKAVETRFEPNLQNPFYILIIPLSLGYSTLKKRKRCFPLFISDQNAQSKSHKYRHQISNKSVSLEYANCIQMMFLSKADKKGSEPGLGKLGTELQWPVFCLRTSWVFCDLVPSSVQKRTQLSIFMISHCSVSVIL